MKKPRKRIANTNQLFYGDEPIFNPQLEPHSNIEIISALSYYNVQLSRDDAKNEVMKYAEQYYTKDIVKHLDKIQWVCNVGALCRMQSRGCIFQDELIIHKKIMQLLDNNIDKPVENDIIKSIKKQAKKKIDTNIDMTYSKFIIDYIEDEALRRTFIKPSNLQKFLDNNKVPTKSYKEIAKIISNYMQEVSSAYNKTDAAIVEGYSTYGKKELRLYLELYNFFVDGLVNLIPKKVRKPRAKKPVDIGKKMANVKYLPYDNTEIMLTGLKPEEILGKSHVLIYNTRYKTMAILVANSKKFDIIGSTIRNLDEEKCRKKILRKPKNMAEDIYNIDTVAGIGKYMDGLSTNWSGAVGALNINSLILRVW